MCEPARRSDPPGFRLWFSDVVVLGAVAGATWALLPRFGRIVWIAPVVFAHFFLFCNVFRVRRRYELAWAGLFVANVLAWLALGPLSWSRILGAQTPITVLLIALEMRSPGYHGIFHERVNPKPVASDFPPAA